MAATDNCALISSALMVLLLSFAAAAPTRRNSLPNSRTPSARRNLISLGTLASLNSLEQTPLRVDCISLLLIAQANSKKAGKESSMLFCISIASFSWSISFPDSAISFCMVSACCMARAPAVAALIPAPNRDMFPPKALAFCFVRAKWPPRPNSVLSNPKNSSALTSSENPIVLRYMSPCAPCAICTASSWQAATKAWMSVSFFCFFFGFA
mmetsp:Transcript_104923/g.157140  ORF Transcript_104923/g.157140 Transcript_104923/m.157140 type:complete len:211 (+) Transcript_104923:353-985(+)